MSADSIKRLVLLIAGVALRLAAPKLHLDQSAVDGSTALLGVFLAQSGVKAGMQAMADKANHTAALEKALQIVSSVQTAVNQTKGTLPPPPAPGAQS